MGFILLKIFLRSSASLFVFYHLLSVLIKMKINKLNEQEIDELLEFGEKFKERLEKEDLKKIEIYDDIDDEYYEDDKNDEGIINQIEKLYDRVNDLKKTKTETIKAVIGQMYKGVLIDNELSIRNGEVFAYKHHSNNWLSLSTIKEKILRGLHQVKKRVSEKNLDILEFILGFVNENDYNFRTKTIINFKLPKEYWFVSKNNRSAMGDLKSFDIKFIRIGFIKFENGKPEFFEDEQQKYNNSTSLSYNQEELLLKKYNKEIEELFEEHIKIKEQEIKLLQEEIERIKEKAGDLLIVAQLKKDNTGETTQWY